MEKIKYLFIHYTKSPMTTKYDDVDRWHRERGFKCIGYNFFIDGNGTGRIGRPDAIQGAHTRGCNGFSLGIAIALNIDENPTDEQIETLISWLTEKCKKYNITTDNILGHKDAYLLKLAKSATNTDCPGNIYYLLPEIRKRVDKNLKSNINVNVNKSIVEIILEIIIKIIKRS